jgi:hypothetical protein
MPPPPLGKPNLLRGARVYLSGPMDFVASREEERKTGWRTRVGQFLRALGVVVFDPWVKPEVRGHGQYGREDDADSPARAGWTFADTKDAARRRAACAAAFWPALHIDLRMVDTSDFVIAFCPTNVYSVGTPHEVVLARQQRKPVLFVSPPVAFPALDDLRRHLEMAGDAVGLNLLGELEAQVPIKPNPGGAPSQWYMPLVGTEHFFDGFGFGPYRARFGWSSGALDRAETARPPARPLLPFLARLNDELPRKWDRRTDDYAPNDDWLLWDLKPEDGGATVSESHHGPSPAERPARRRGAKGR